MVVNLRKTDHFSISAAGSPVYDLVLACHGYEQRATNIPSMLRGAASRYVAIGFDSRQVHSFLMNGKVLHELGYDLREVSDWEVKGVVDVLLKELVIAEQIDEVPRLALDCSSFSRLRLAGIFAAISEFPSRIDLDVFYSPARFASGNPDPEVLRVAEPISFEYSGWNSDQERPVAVLIGVGYEDGRATGIAEFLDAPNIHVFSPTGVDPAYDDAVLQANADFFESFPVHTYNVRAPSELFARLESLSYGLRRSHRISIVPLGPKIFAVSAMLVSFNSSHQDAVWRFSSDTGEEPVQKVADGSHCVLPVRLAGSETLTAAV